jgi:hypothetical protein
MKSLRALLSVAGVATAMIVLTAPTFADDAWQKDHPRREEVNNRLANQNARINKDVKNGTLSAAQAAHLHHEDRQIRREERAMASQNNTHITKLEQRALNQQENKVSHQIAKESGH